MIWTDDLRAADSRQFDMFSSAAAHNSGASSTPVTLLKPYSAARMHARPRPHPRSANCRVLDRLRRFRSARKAQPFTGPYDVASGNLERSNEVLESSTWPLVLIR